ncbi:cyclase family protein [Pararhodobacter aggregans]|uniref:Cyclase n=1 Tax=Pararhodobacter aggregans TaxID=404875 RepID=A0A2T7UL98_9RHOB|nr:cyclase family protein [Pararhodobacter aggregans]PTX05302.1 kynurenine formamidase [Pararhodobacter aggregans]PVE45447.1 cyclase [Pararhodobacter aggregans]
MRIIDLSVALETGIASDPEMMLPKIQYQGHKETREQITAFFPGLKNEDLPEGDGWAVEWVQLSTHNGTHLDAPYHHHSTMDRALTPGGRPAITIDEVPLEWCFQPGVKLDFRHFPDGYVVTAADVEAELARIGHTLSPLEIVVVNTAAGAAYGKPDFLLKGCGMGREATMYLLERGVRVTGTDAWSWDAPFPFTARAYAESHDPAIIWEGHRASMEIGYCHMEKLSNLDQLPATGFKVSCFPFKIRKASAGFTRCVAILE